MQFYRKTLQQKWFRIVLQVKLDDKEMDSQ